MAMAKQGKKLSDKAAKSALRKGRVVTVPFHVEGYGPGRTQYSWGDFQLGEANGPEGYLRVGLDDDGDLIIDEWDTDVAPEELHGIRIDGGGSIVVRD